jgi:peptidoglycan pentaglycine glycine transferase (the first glycine)
VSDWSRQDCSHVREVSGYPVRISNAPDDPAWDDFVEKEPSSAFQQTSGWGRARAFVGWQRIRVVISDGARVVAGVQMLLRALPAGGRVGLVSRGPVVPEDRPDLVKLVFDEMMAMGRRSRVRCLVVHAPRGSDWMGRELRLRGLRPSAFEFDYTATVCVDLQPNLDEILGQMRKHTRQRIRTAAKKGQVTIRRGSEADLSIFSRVKDVHATRLGYDRKSEDYYAELWRALAPRDHVALFIAEYEDEPISVQLCVPFGDTCYEIEHAWSGEHGKLGPNELLEWEIIRWAKSKGLRIVDQVGFQRSAAEAMLAGEETPSQLRSADCFKLAFSHHLELLPEGYDYLYNPVLRLAYRSIPRKMLTSTSMSSLVRRLRMRAQGRRAT